jgi:Tol biopolymer transport system component
MVLPLVCAAEARIRVSAPGRQAQTGSGETARLIWSGQDILRHVGERLERIGLSNDGTWLAFVDWSQRGNVALRNVATGDVRFVTDGPVTESASWPAISADGTRVAFAWFDGATRSIRVVSADGGRPQVLWQSTGSPRVYPRSIAWAPDGRHLAAVLDTTSSSSAIVLISVSTGTVTPLKSLTWRPSYASAANENVLGGFSPDGRYLVYALPNQPPSTPGGIFVIAADGSQETTLVEGGAGERFPSWAADGAAVVFVRDTGLWSIRIRDGKPTGEPVLLRGELRGIAGLGFTSDGSYVYATLNLRRGVYMAGLDPATLDVTAPASLLVDQSVGLPDDASWSPDGKLLAFVRSTPAGTSVVIRSPDGSERTVLGTFRTDVAGRVSWFPDSRSLLVPQINRTTRQSTFRKVSVETGQASVVLEGPNWERRDLVGPSPDGKSVYYTKVPDSQAPATTDVRISRLIRRDLESGAETELYRSEKVLLSFSPAISPDSRRLAFMIGSALMTVATDGRTPPIEIARGQFLVSTAQNQSLVWSADGRHVLVVAREPAVPERVWAFPAEGGAPRRLELSMEQIRLTGVSPDGRRLAFTGSERQPEIRSSRNLLGSAPAK